MWRIETYTGRGALVLGFDGRRYYVVRPRLLCERIHYFESYFHACVLFSLRIEVAKHELRDQRRAASRRAVRFNARAGYVPRLFDACARALLGYVRSVVRRASRRARVEKLSWLIRRLTSSA